MDAVRRQIATRFIENRDRPWNAVSEQLGFSGLSAFLRWFFEIASVAVCRLGVSPTLASTSGGKIRPQSCQWAFRNASA
jgi:AraC-like DNA-binding protein